MKSEFIEIEPVDFRDNVFKLIGADWMLITAGNMESFNTMTASWGGLGHLWQKNVCFVFVRPQRHTYRFMEKSDLFSLTFFDETYRHILKLCGSKSGRTVDKIAATGLEPKQTVNGSIYYGQARIALECRKIYGHDINPANFIDRAIDNDIYPQKDYHRMYIGQIVKVLVNKTEFATNMQNIQKKCENLNLQD